MRWRKCSQKGNRVLKSYRGVSVALLHRVNLEISRFAEIAVKNYIQELKKGEKLYFAFKGEEKIAEAKSLEELVRMLKEEE